MDLFVGRELESGEPIRYPARHLTTHGLIFGMTGSGKTGLALTLLEEALRGGVPLIAIDPKGDLANLALAWPDLAPERFAAWLPEGSGDRLAEGARLAERWKSGLAADGLTPDDIAAMRERSHLTVFTPGSTAGVPVSLLRALSPPPGFAELPAEDRSDLIAGVVGALLSLVRVPADPLQSREAILVSNILAYVWERGQPLDLAGLIRLIDTPPMQHLGVFPIDEVHPPKKRRELAMQLNGLIASPSFAAWMEGPGLDPDALLARPVAGGPARASIFSLAHLDDSERMSFVTLLLERLVAWMRQQPGTGELRALFYMDEVFGYLPPHPANPASKRPIMTLLKQARAFGLGCVLATQNPVDVDYKALSNAGTWLIGKLQTEQDRDRVLDGLMAADSGAGSLSRGTLSRLVGGLEGRQFVLQSAHLGAPRVMRTRMAMSFLRGPMTRQELARLKAADFFNRVRLPASPAEPSRALLTSPPAPVAPVAAEPPLSGAWVAPVPRTAPVEAASSPQPPESGPALPERWLGRGARSHPDVARLLALPTTRGTGLPSQVLPALYAEATLTGVAVPNGPSRRSAVPVALKAVRVVSPLPGSARNIAWRALPDVLPADAEAPLGAVVDALPDWLEDGSAARRVELTLLKHLAEPLTRPLPWSERLGVVGGDGETLERFRARLAPMLAAAANPALNRADAELSAQTQYFTRELATLKELLEMDRRELASLRARGDVDALSRAELRAKNRIERYRELVAMRDRFLGQASFAKASVELAMLEAQDDLAVRTFAVEVREVTVTWCGLLWVPAEPL